MLLRGIVRVRHGGRSLGILRSILRLAGRALGQLPLVAVQVLHEVVVPLHRVGGPGAFEAAGDRVPGLAAAVGVLPAEALLIDAGPLRLGADRVVRGGAVRLAERVTAGDQGDRLLVVHRHALERLADELRRQARVRVAVRPLRVDVDQPHVVGADRSLELSVRVVALVVEPRRLRAPVRLVSLPDVRPPEGETEGPEPHRLQGAVAGEDDQVGPRKGCGRTSS